MRRYGSGLLFDLLDHKEADLSRQGPARDEDDLVRLDQFREVVVREEQGRPHRLADLAVGGDDLIALGYAPGPAIGQALETLLREVVDEPALNRREALLERAKELAGPDPLGVHLGRTSSPSRRGSAVSAEAPYESLNLTSGTRRRSRIRCGEPPHRMRCARAR